MLIAITKFTNIFLSQIDDTLIRQTASILRYMVIHQEAIIHLILEIAICPNVALCVEAGFCQIQSHIIYSSLQLSSSWLVCSVRMCVYLAL